MKQVELKLTEIHLPLAPKCWNERYGPHYLALFPFELLIFIHTRHHAVNVAPYFYTYGQVKERKPLQSARGFNSVLGTRIHRDKERGSCLERTVVELLLESGLRMVMQNFHVR